MVLYGLQTDGEPPAGPMRLAGAAKRPVSSGSRAPRRHFPEASVSHLRQHRGEHEADLIVDRRDGKVVALEVKLAAADSSRDLKHLQ
jgi:uncharacterized protein